MLAIQQFFFDILMSITHNTLAGKIQHATQEFTKVLQDDKTSISYMPHFSYADINKIIEKICSNDRLLNDILLSNMLGMGMGPFYQQHT